MSEVNSVPGRDPRPGRGSSAPLGDRAHSTRHLLMVRPSHFGFNPETSPTNRLQTQGPSSGSEVSDAALAEFDSVVEALLRHGAEPFVVADERDAATPDAVFPNNWLSTHGDGTLIRYPLLAPSRRRERRPVIVERLGQRFSITRVVDLTPLEEQGAFLEGTGSLVFDRSAGIAYAALSARTTRPALERFAEVTGYGVVDFSTDDGNGLPVYHTNVVLGLGTRVALYASDCVVDAENRRRVMDALCAGREVIELDRAQAASFAANWIEVHGKAGPLMVLSTTGWASLEAGQRQRLARHGTPVFVDIPVIERIGGGGVRCMLAEIHLPSEVG